MLELNWFAKAKENQTIREHTDGLLEQARLLHSLDYISNDFYRLLCIVCEWHDTGKSNPKFQFRIENHTKFDVEKELVHQFCSALLYLKHNCYKVKPQKLTDEEKLILFVILHHHNYDWERMQVDMNCESVASQLLNKDFEIEDIFFRKNIFSKVLKDVYLNNSKDVTMLKGALHTCDYSASGNLPCEIKNDFLSDSLDDWKNKNNIQYKEMQSFALNHTNDNILLIASTGSGKTEAGLLWSGDNKTFFVLPLRAAMTAIYDRIRYNLFDNHNFYDKVGILYADTKSKYANLDVNNSFSLSNYVNETRNLSLPITISTIDQLWNVVYKQNNYDKILFTLSYSKVILDEIQMYDPELLAILLSGMKQMYELGTKFAVMTATLSPFVKHLLYQKTGIDFKEDIYLSNENRHNIKVYKKSLELNDILEVYNSKQNGKMLVFCNRTSKAVSLYVGLKALQEKGLLSGIKIKLLHAKFIGKEKEKLLAEIISDGKTETKTDCIWIVTNIAEVSLDLDFDYGLSELYDYSSILQRQGRINRKGIKLSNDTNFYIYTEIDDNIFISETNRFGTLDPDVYNLSKKSVLDLDGLVTEKKKIDLLNKYFTYDNLKDTKYYKIFEEKFSELERVEREFDKSNKKVRDIRQITILPKVIYEENKTEIDNIVNNIDIFSKSIVTESDKNIKSGYKKKLVMERQKLLSYCVSDYYERYASHLKSGKVYGKLANLVDVVDIKYSHTCGLGYGNDSGIDYNKPIFV